MNNTVSPALAWVTLGVIETIPSSASTLGGEVVVDVVVGDVIGVGANGVDVVGAGVAIGGFGFGFGCRFGGAGL